MLSEISILWRQSKWNWKRLHVGQVTISHVPLQSNWHPLETFFNTLLFLPFTFNKSLKRGVFEGSSIFFFVIKVLCCCLTQTGFLPNLCPVAKEDRGVNLRPKDEIISFSLEDIVWTSLFLLTRFFGASGRVLFFGTNKGVTFLFFAIVLSFVFLRLLVMIDSKSPIKNGGFIRKENTVSKTDGYQQVSVQGGGQNGNSAPPLWKSWIFFDWWVLWW